MTTANASRSSNNQAKTTGPATNPALRFELKANTDAGARLIRVAEETAVEFADAAAEHDQDATYPFEVIDSLSDSGYFTAPIPEQFGGLGVESIHDVLVASSRLARTNPSVTIGVNMHLAAVANMARRYSLAVATGNERRANAFGQSMKMIVDGDVVMAAAVSEPAQDLTRPDATAVRTDNGWVINGMKIFCTMSPAANALYVAVTYENDDGQELYGFALIPKVTAGVTVNDDWDALGMRSSGSNSVVFKDVHVPANALRGGFPAGELTAEFMERNISAGPFHASGSLGIAEAAHEIAVNALAKKRRGDDTASPHTQMLAAQNAIDISAMRSIFDRAGNLIDDYYAKNPATEAGIDEMAALFAEVQSAKTFINEAAQRVVDRALSLSGGGGYFSKHPLSRAYRDVRAGAFMHPLGANRAYEFIGEIALGLKPTLR